ncbi:MAG: histidinol-phosphate transaminase [Granulosicoccaceae bacterium]
MSQFWSPGIDQLSPYIPGEQPKISGLIKLNTNESPDPPSPKVLEAIRAAASDELRLYSDPTSSELVQALADYHHVDCSQVFVGNGSDEVLAHAFYAFFRQTKPLLTPDISYSFYPVYAGLYQIQIRVIPLNHEFAIDPADYVGDSGGVVIANPNAPTGCLLPLQAVEQIAEQNRHCVVLVDEAYIDFGGESALGLLDRFDNVLVVRTFSKSRALAGLRVGYALGSPALIDGLVRVKDSFNSYPLDRLAQAGAVASLADDVYFTECCQKTVANREKLAADLGSLGFTCLPSAANFLFAKHSAVSAVDIALNLRKKNVLVRHFSSGRTSEFLRISIGSEEQCELLLKALADALSSC